MYVKLVNNTNCDIRIFDRVILDCIDNNTPLPEELADLFVLQIVVVDGRNRGILTMA